jgi:ABC-2 type transport system permease protein
MPAVYVLSLRQLQSRWRIIALLAVMAIPLVPVIVAFATTDKLSALDLDDTLINGLLASAILPVIALVVSTPVFGNEVEDKTLANLTLTPLRRWRIVAPKVAAAISISVPLVAISTLVSVFLAFEGAELEGGAQAAIASTIGLAIGAIVYGAIFVWLGLVSRRALGIGLLYAFVWEGLFGTFVDGLKYLSVKQYALSILHELDPARFDGSSQSVIGITTAAIASSIVLVLFTFLTVRRLRTMDVP